MSRSTIAKLETGERLSSGSATVEALAGAFDVAPSELLGDVDASAPRVYKMAKYVDAYLRSPEAKALRPTKAEITWLRESTELLVDDGGEPTNEMFVLLLTALRQRAPKKTR